MIFQILLMDSLRNTFYYLQTGGILDIVIPFVLIFTVLFTVLKKVSLFKDEPRYQIAISLAITFLVLIPHITGTIMPEYDVVNIITNSLPAVVVIIFVFLTVLILLGLTRGGQEVKFGEVTQGIFSLLAIILVTVIFARSAGYIQSSSMPTWLYWLDDPQLGALIVVILLFVVITWFITKPAGQTKWYDTVGSVIKKIGKDFGGFGGGTQ